uniref:1-phosphatidylinositol 4-kinase n=1 Tax=Ananas comosus var. bracteatus TaxID=296719 RepID=A0A6V7QJW3_ANACO|nr:unnamed protein product [Ananas comosus var. bracteatus]
MSSAGAALSPIREDSILSPIRFDGSRSPHCSQEPILIFLAVPGSLPIPIRILESDSIKSVKLRIQQFKGFVVKNQKLVFDGRELARNNSLVRDYGVTDGNMLHLVIRLSNLRVITVKTVCGKKFEFQVERSRNIGYIKQQIAKKGKDFGDLEDQKLVFDGEELEDHRLITDICKSNDAVIHLLIRKSAKARAEPVGKDFELSVVAPDVKEKLQLDALQLFDRSPLPRRNSWVEPVVINPKVELSPLVMNMIRETFDGLEKGNPPIMSAEGSGGAYFMQDFSGHKYVAVFKPIDEEPMAENNPRGLPLSTDGEGLKRGTRVGEGALREVAAYILDHPIGGRRLCDEIGLAGFRQRYWFGACMVVTIIKKILRSVLYRCL